MMPRPSSDNMDNGYPSQSYARNPTQQRNTNFPNTGNYGADQPSDGRQRLPAGMDPQGAGGGMMGGGGGGYSVGRGQDMGAGASPNPAMGGGMGGGGGQQPYSMSELSPQLRMQMSQMYQGMGGSNPSPNFPPMAMQDLDGSGRGIPGGAGGAGAGTGASGAAGGGSGSQADREEELLLNLLIARRQRGRMSGDASSASSQTLADELMRLRQSRAASMSSSQRGMPPMPGMPPIFSDTPMMGGMVPPPNYEAYMQAQGMGDVAERIDRPTRMLDARSQEMQDLSGRGMKRGQPMSTEFANLKYHASFGAMQGFQMPPAKKKRTHKKKPSDMPRRPLSAYNLFFSEERERILKEIDEKEGGGESKDKDAETKEGETEPKEEGGEDEEAKPAAMQRPLVPSQKKRRPHRKTHGKISFQQLARMVGERWKKLDPEKKEYYQGLAKEDMKRQKIAMEEYYQKQNAPKKDAEKDQGNVSAEGTNVTAEGTIKVEESVQPVAEAGA